MSRTIKTWLLLLSLSLTLFSCEKEYSEENGGTVGGGGGGTQGGTAVFTLAGAPGGCTTPSITGTYKAGTALTSTEKITLIVNVTTIGTYTISTGTANGITFSGSGTFTATGQQFIELTATGSTPTNAGTFSYLPGTAGCSFSITYLASTGSSSGTAVYTFKGAPDDCLTPVISGTYTAGTATNTTNTVKLLVNVTTAGTYTITTGTANGISFSATGTFAAPGDADITLVASGTPVSAGTVQYTPGATGCSFSITVGAGTPPASNTFLKATMGGTATEFNTGLSGMLLSGMSGIPSSLTATGTISSPSTGSDNLSVAFTNTTAGSSITTGAYPNISVTNTTKGVIVRYFNNAGDLYQSGFTADTFTANVSTVSSTAATGTFSGTLYKNGAGPESIVVTNGSFSVTY
ncbi:hypothetical protein [Ferruginibacter sp. HRS2-29]|uniref:hypothetical protein n=1 Tax=Ferruginibacter sp. HRS2-29 TaxID=2487334 RepID=UPI0020CFA6EF|nr:hypothetical protein [Ferruginibacter sp. HRS2-29]MCP9750119.1 hypothetical protein [Ferruginibacter sp. HRS2-29]